jgi:hypothetical protein
MSPKHHYPLKAQSLLHVPSALTLQNFSHRLYLWDWYVYQNKQRLYSWTALIDLSLWWRFYVFSARYTLNLKKLVSWIWGFKVESDWFFTESFVYLENRIFKYWSYELMSRMQLIMDKLRTSDRNKGLSIMYIIRNLSSEANSQINTLVFHYRTENDTEPRTSAMGSSCTNQERGLILVAGQKP